MGYSKHMYYDYLKNNVYVLYNKKINLYKFGITELDINRRIHNYCVYEGYSQDDIFIIFFHTYKNGVEVENLLSKSINGKRVKMPGSNYNYKEHFRKEELENILRILESQK